ncbi:hypothetical protein F5Y16DRAFT_378561 [Xylariaceae sp. FL0255]|nr:hypothetical protein F5Y16DRAFT_378561 [Xylariaceae sp. FL0255]
MGSVLDRKSELIPYVLEKHIKIKLAVCRHLSLTTTTTTKPHQSFPPQSLFIVQQATCLLPTTHQDSNLSSIPMYLATFALFSLLVSSAQALTFPKNQPDGVYVVHNIDAPGHEIFERLAPPQIEARSQETITPAMKQFSPRQWQQTDGQYIACGCGIILNHADTDAAVSALKAQMVHGSYVEANTCWYSITNSVVAFTCAYGVALSGTNDA